jgi:nucleotide-binding universal stress UspA family protein
VGSPGAVAASDAARTLLGPRAATVVSVWCPIMAVAPVAGGIPAYLSDLDPKLDDEARELAEQGARLARDAGFDADCCTVGQGAAWLGITEMAETLDAEVIVVGARGLSGLKSVVLGSTSNGVLHHTTRPVLVVHEPEA